MTESLHLDTHIVMWLYTGKRQKIPAAVSRQLEYHALRISPMVRLELEYMVEIGRLVDPPTDVIRELSSSIGLELDDQPFQRVAEIAADCSFTRDAFDRVITAQAIAARARLVTADERIRSARPDVALWD